MSKGLPIVLSIPARFKEDRGAKDKGEKKPHQVFALVKKIVKFFASGGQGDSFRENRPPGPPAKAFD